MSCGGGVCGGFGFVFVEELYGGRLCRYGGILEELVECDVGL